MLRQQFVNIFEKVQESSACHQKYIQVLTQLYIKAPSDFNEIFLQFLQMTVEQTTENNVYINKVLSFVSRFCGEISRKEEKENDTQSFLTCVLHRALQWSSLDMYNLRYNSCRFITMVLQNIGNEVQLEVDLIDEIQEVMLERMQEPKVAIRLKAMSALVRLQDPQNFECPVIDVYIQALASGNVNMRREATALIAPNILTLSKIKDRVRDVDPSVRSVAFHKCGDIGPMPFKIVEKHVILLCGFKETNNTVRNAFFDYLLPKWLTAYKGKFLEFVGALKLIADEEDISKIIYLTKELIKEFYNKHSLNDLKAVLPINDEKLVDIESLNNDVTLYWSILVELLRSSNGMDEHLDDILPELTPFCHYIQRVVGVKSNEKMDEWKFFEYQFDLLNLFEIAENYDFSDEVGRRTLHSLAISVLQDHNVISKLTKKLVSIVQKCSSSIEFFTNDMCQLISEIREPLVEEAPSEDLQRDQAFKAAELRVKINILKEQQSEAVAVRDYQKAQLLDNELVSCNRELERFQDPSKVEKVRVAKSDNETLCRCLDILIGTLELPVVAKLTPSLITCKNNFVMPLISNQGAEPHWRILRCLVLISVIDKTFAEEYAKLICIPVSGAAGNVIKMWEEALRQISNEKWPDFVHHTDKIIMAAYEKENVIDDVRPLIFTVNRAESDDEYNYLDDDLV